MQGSRSGAGVCFWVRLLVARCLRKWRRQARPTAPARPGRSGPYGCAASDPKSVSSRIFVPTGACLGVLAAVRLPRALECVVGRRASACAFGHCVRNGRVSGDWLVWVLDPCSGSDNPLQAASVVGTSALPPWPGRFPVLRTCCEGILLSRTSRLRPAPRPTGLRSGRTSRHTLCPAIRAPVRAGPLDHGVVARSLGCGKHGGYEARALFALKQAFYASCERRPSPSWARPMRAAGSVRNATWLILPVVICLSQRLSHAYVNSRANTCNKPRLLEGMHLLDKRSTRALPVAAMIHDNSTDRTALVPATHHSNFCPINFRWQQARKLPNPDTVSRDARTLGTLDAYSAMQQLNSADQQPSPTDAGLPQS
ncbi:UNVERIFIED_CONTAM: hypothetical protein Scaly_3129400 [Sesamum calycinum]|uniref:Uncharacterized protein n=1 Tax=Sesamum calycinum TaxID=2727403 RepID=A0AAW2JIK1_9LAMI